MSKDEGAMLMAAAQAACDGKVLKATLETMKLLSRMMELGKSGEAKGWTLEQARAFREEQRETIQKLHDAACDWLDVHERVSAILGEGRQDEPKGFDFDGVFGRM